MSDSDDDFLLPDNSNKKPNASQSAGKPPSVVPTVFGGAPSPAAQDDDPVPVGFPGQPVGNVDYASGLLAARRRGLQQQPLTTSRNNSPGVRKASPTGTSSQAAAGPTTPLGRSPSHPSTVTQSSPLLPSVGPTVTNSSPRAEAVGTKVSAPPVEAATAAAAAAADEALFRLLNPSQAPPAVSAPPSSIPHPTVLDHTTQRPQTGSTNASPAHVAAIVQQHVEVASQPAVVPGPAVPSIVADRERVAKLRSELEAKKRAVAQARERQQALTERTRAEKAKRTAELQSLEAQLKRQWDEVEAEKERLESKHRQDEEAQEALLRTERTRLEAEETAKHQPQLEALQSELRDLQEKESVLRHKLSAAAANKDVVSTAVNGAIAEIMKRLHVYFKSADQPSAAGATPQDSTSAQSLAGWEEDVRQLVRKEIHSAFVSNVGSAAEAERNEFAKSFDEMLRFWREAEEEEQRHVTKMDEQLLLDLQSMAHEDLDRLQREENAIEELFMASREQWSQHHSKVLHEELEATIARRTKELEAQRALRTELHQRRLRAIEDEHRQQVENSKAAHENRLDLIRKEHHMLERLHDAKLDMFQKVREEVQKSAQTVNASVDAMSETLLKMKNLKRSLDDVRASLDEDRKRSLELREATLSDVQGLIVAQASAVEQERSALGSALMKLDVTQAAVERQLEQERLWVAETQAKLERQRSDWEREYRRWQHTTAQEKRNMESRFSELLLQLSDTTSVLESESREIEVEGNAMRRACTARSTAIADEIAAVEKKQEHLNERQQQMTLLLTDLEVKSRLLSEEWQRMLIERQTLATQRAELEREELKLAQMGEQLDFMKNEVSRTQAEAREAADRGRFMADQLEATRDATREGLERVKRHAEHLARTQQQQMQASRRAEAAAVNHPNPASLPTTYIVPHAAHSTGRLPMQLLTELRDSLRPSFVDPQPRRHPQAFQGPSQPSAGLYASPGTTSGSSSKPPGKSTTTSGGSDPLHATSTSASTAVTGTTSMLSPDDEWGHNTVGGTSQSQFQFTNLVGVSDAETTSLSQHGGGGFSS